MPELPEVETIVRSLRGSDSDQDLDLSVQKNKDSILNKVISEAEIFWDRSLVTPSVSEFKRQVTGKQISAVERRGKFIVIHLNELHLLIHLRMSGDIFIEKDDAERNKKHNRMILSFNDKSRMVFNDPRKFGRVWLMQDVEEVTGKLGPEPFSDELTDQVFYQRLRKAKRMIKPLLMDQSFLAGMGNIYTDEALYLAKIHPETPASLITENEAHELLQSIRSVLTEGIRRNGASIDWVYRGGDFQNHFSVYQRDGQACPRCGTSIERIVVGQRGTHFCPRCQTKRTQK